MSENIYQIYKANGCQCPFYVRSEGWRQIVFLVESIGGKVSGQLSGKPPYHGNVVVAGHFVDSITGETVQDRFWKNGALSSPGNYKWILAEVKESKK